MRKFLHIFAYEYRRHVFRWSFLLALLRLPGAFLLMVAILFLIISFSIDRRPAGVVDLSGLEVDADVRITSQPSRQVRFLTYESEAQARAALDAGEIQAYFILPPDFQQARSAEVYYRKRPGAMVFNHFNNIVLAAYLADLPSERRERLILGTTIVPLILEKGFQEAGSGLIRYFIPMIGYFLIYGAVNFSTGYLTTSLVEERASRTLEIMVTSVSPDQLMIAKTLAMIAVAMTLLLTWGSVPLMALVFAPLVGLSMVDLLPFDPLQLGLVLSLVVPTFLLNAALIAGMSALFYEGGTLGSFFNFLVTMFLLLPLLLVASITKNHDGILALVFSYLPPTAVMTLLMRLSVAPLPLWQIATSGALLWLSSISSLWLAARMFRAGLLRFGSPSHLRVWMDRLAHWMPAWRLRLD